MGIRAVIRTVAATEHTSGIDERDHFEQDLGIERHCICLVILMSTFKHRQIDMLLDQGIDRIFRRPGFKLILERYGEHDQLVVIVGFEFCHRFLYTSFTYR